VIKLARVSLYREEQTGDDLKFKDGDTVCIVGGGPGGSACAIALKKEARKLGKTANVVVMEHKKFTESRHYNQCIGIRSPPLESDPENSGAFRVRQLH